MKKYIKIWMLMTMIFQESEIFAQKTNEWNVEQIPVLPDVQGFAGMYAGVIEGMLVVAGGANFPDKMPWEGGVKRWYNTIYTLDEETKKWRMSDVRLPDSLAYGVSTSYDGNILIVGGSNNSNQPVTTTCRITLEKGQLAIKKLSPLPMALVNMCGTLVGDYLFVAGGSTSSDGWPTTGFFVYDIRLDYWKQLADIPGPARINAVSASAAGVFYLFSGIQLDRIESGIKRTILTDAYSYTPQIVNGVINGGKWKRLADMPRGMAAGPSPAATSRNDKHILIFGGLDDKTAQHADPRTHPGFLPDLLQYDVAKDTWHFCGTLPKKEMRLTLPSVTKNGKYLLINGEIGPGVRTNTTIVIDINAQ